MFVTFAIHGSNELPGGGEESAELALDRARRIITTLGDDVSAIGFGIAMAVAIGAVIAGGIKSIARLTQRLIPAAVVVYVLFALKTE